MTREIGTMYKVHCHRIIGVLLDAFMTKNLSTDFLVLAGCMVWVGRVSPPGLKELFNLPFLVLKARHPVNQINSLS